MQASYVTSYESVNLFMPLWLTFHLKKESWSLMQCLFVFFFFWSHENHLNDFKLPLCVYVPVFSLSSNLQTMKVRRCTHLDASPDECVCVCVHVTVYDAALVWQLCPFQRHSKIKHAYPHIVSLKHLNQRCIKYKYLPPSITQALLCIVAALPAQAVRTVPMIWH